VKFKEFTIGASHTFNLGNFESMRIEASVTVEPEKGEREVVSRAQSQLRKLIEDTLKSQPHSELLVMLHELHIARAKQRQQMKDMENDRQQSADEPPEPPAGYGT
jgi:hypothetical protein